jgi:fatty acid desaturase
VFFIARMANPDSCDPARSNKWLAAAAKRSVSEKKDDSSWLRSLAAGMAILALGSFGAVVAFDWYFFSVVDGVATDLRPVMGALHPTSHGTRSVHSSRANPNIPENTPDQLSHAGGARLFPVRSSTNPKPSDH